MPASQMDVYLDHIISRLELRRKKGIERPELYFGSRGVRSRILVCS